MKKENQCKKKRLKVSVVMVAAAAMAGLMSCTVYADSVVIRAGNIAESYGPGYVHGLAEGNTVRGDAGWRYLDGNWYFYDSSAEGTPGMKTGGWLWVDGYCYYFYDDGKMAAAGITPDGYQVSESGAWVENGATVYVPGKGIMTQTSVANGNGNGFRAGMRGGGSGNSGGGSGSSGGGSGSSGGGSGSTGGGSGNSGGGSGSTGDGSGNTGGGSGNSEGGSGSTGGGSGSTGGGSGNSGGGNSNSGNENDSPEDGSIGSDLEDDGSADTEEEEEPDSEAEVQLRLEYWQNLAWAADHAITGIDNPLDKSHLVQGKDANDRRMKNLVSMISDWEPHEFYMIGVDYQADTLILGQIFREQIIYSNTVVDSFDIHGVHYTISRIGIQKIQDNTQDGMEDGTITDGPEEGEEDNPSVGMHYSYGDVISRRIGRQSYRFRCIDEDYRDASGNYRGVALFLCDTVIRSDVDGDGVEEGLLKFGTDNNYKNSEVRKWLNRNTADSGFPETPVSIGIDNAYEGFTEPDCWEQINADELHSYPLKRQKLNDGIFLLSVEEAMEYAEELWRFGGSESNNPEEQYSPWSKGYYLRTPLYEEDEDGEFCYGGNIYIVDLLEGNIHAVDVSYTTIGLRPAFVLPNA